MDEGTLREFGRLFMLIGMPSLSVVLFSGYERGKLYQVLSKRYSLHNTTYPWLQTRQAPLIGTVRICITVLIRTNTIQHMQQYDRFSREPNAR